MPDHADLTSPILDLVRKAIPNAKAPAPIDCDTDLPSAGLTSMAMVRLMLAVEAAFDLAIPDADLSPENFRSVRALNALVTRLKIQ
jgi:acyl carrier protein